MLIYMDTRHELPALGRRSQAAFDGGASVDRRDGVVTIPLPGMWLGSGYIDLLQMAVDELGSRLDDLELDEHLQAEHWERLQNEVLRRLKEATFDEDVCRHVKVSASVAGHVSFSMPAKVWALLKRPDGFDLLADLMGEPRPDFEAPDELTDEALKELDEDVQTWMKSNSGWLEDALRGYVMNKIDTDDVFDQKEWNALMALAVQKANRNTVAEAMGGLVPDVMKR